MNKWVLIGCIMVCSNVFGQQIPFYNHHFLNPFVYNPAFTGQSGDIRTSLVRNSRNASFDGGAINNYLTVDGAFSERNSGLGLMLMAQKHGIQQQFGGNLSYAYRLKINAKHAFRFGVQVGFLDNQLDQSEINVQQEDDPFLQDLRKNKLAFNGAAGLAYEWNHLRIGFAVPQIIGNRVSFGTPSGNRGFYQLERHYMASAAYSFELSKNGDWLLKPNALMRFAPGAPIQYDGLLQVEHQKWGWVAAGYKSDYAIEFNAGVRLFDALELGYSYEWVIGNLSQYHTGMNHEFLLGYTIGRGDKRQLAELERKNQQLIADREAAERRLREMQENWKRERAQFVQDSIRMQNALRDSLQALEEQNKRLEENNKALTEEVKKEKEATTKAQTQQNTARREPEGNITTAKGYHFIELNEGESPEGYYVITGVFSSRSNAESQQKRCVENGFDQTKLVINKNTGLYYTVILYTMEKGMALSTNDRYMNNVNKKTWILHYIR